MWIIDESEKFQSLGIIIIFSIKFFDHYGVQDPVFRDSFVKRTRPITDLDDGKVSE